MPQYLEAVTLGQLLTMATIIGSVAAVLRRTAPTMRQIAHLVDDVVGEEARPGVPRRPGLLERMDALEIQTATITNQLADVRSELAHLNEGKTR